MPLQRSLRSEERHRLDVIFDQVAHVGRSKAVPENALLTVCSWGPSETFLASNNAGFSLLPLNLHHPGSCLATHARNGRGFDAAKASSLPSPTVIATGRESHQLRHATNVVAYPLLGLKPT